MNLIQVLNPESGPAPRPVIIGIAGKARSGKDTIADIIRGYLLGVEKLAFADALKKGCAATLGVSESMMYSMDRESKIPGLKFSVREMLQHIGTEGWRALDPDIWVQIVGKRVQDMMVDRAFTGVVIPDVRFQNEAAWVRRHDLGRMIHVVRDGVGPVGITGHASEAGVPVEPGDVVLKNDGCLLDLRAKVHDLLQNWPEKYRPDGA